MELRSISVRAVFHPSHNHSIQEMGFTMKLRLLFATVVAAAGLCQAGPVTVLSNLPGTSNYTGSSVPLSLVDWYVAGVQTGSADLIFTAMDVYLANYGGSATVNGGIYTDAAGQLGALYAAFVSQTFGYSATPQLHTFVAAAPSVTLAANTKYWFLMDDAGGVEWLGDNSNSGAGAVPTACSGCTFLGYQGTGNSGSSWFPVLLANPTVAISATTVSAVPEPGSLLLLAGGLSLLGALKFRR